MPLYYFKCIHCNSRVNVFCKTEKLKEERHCVKCNTVLKRAPNAPSTNVKETLDNGIMARRVERIADAEEVNRERARQDTLERMADDKT